MAEFPVAQLIHCQVDALAFELSVGPATVTDISTVGTVVASVTVGDVPQVLVAVTVRFPPLVPAVVAMVFVVDVPDQPDGIVHA